MISELTAEDRNLAAGERSLSPAHPVSARPRPAQEWVEPCLSGDADPAQVAEQLVRRAALMRALGVKHLSYLDPGDLPWFVAPFILNGEGSLAEAVELARRDRDIAARLPAGLSDVDKLIASQPYIEGLMELDEAVGRAELFLAFTRMGAAARRGRAP